MYRHSIIRRNIKIRTLVLLVFFKITSVSYGQDSAYNNIKFIQGDSIYLVDKNTDSILLNREPFGLRYFCKQYDEKRKKYYAAQIAVLENSEDTTFLKIGQSTKEIPYFESGTGMAPGTNEMYDTVFVTNTGHHYLTYENENEKRVFLISKSKDILELEWKISAAFYKEKDVQFSELKLSTLYFVVFIDNNLNGVIDKDELKIIKVKFN